MSDNGGRPGVGPSVGSMFGGAGGFSAGGGMPGVDPSLLASMGIDLAGAKRSLVRRMYTFAVFGTLSLASLFAPWAWFGDDPSVHVGVTLALGLVALGGSLGLRRGAGCLASVGGVVWVFGLLFGAGVTSAQGKMSLAAGLVSLSLLYFLVPKRESPWERAMKQLQATMAAAGGDTSGMPGAAGFSGFSGFSGFTSSGFRASGFSASGFSASGTSEPGDVIDVEAQEREPARRSLPVLNAPARELDE